PPRISSAFTRCAVLTRSGSLSSTVTPPRPICTSNSSGSSHASRRSPADARPRRVATLAARISTVAARAESRCPYSISTSARSGGTMEPWQSGQSGQARPEPVALTTLPRVISRNTETTAAKAILARTGHHRVGGHVAVVAARVLPAEEDHRERDQEDQAAGDPHDESAQVLVDPGRERVPHPRRRRVV